MRRLALIVTMVLWAVVAFGFKQTGFTDPIGFVFWTLLAAGATVLYIWTGRRRLRKDSHV